MKNQRYHWDIYKILEKIECLERLWQQEQDAQKRKLIRYDILLLKNYVDEYFEADIPEEIPKLLNCYEYLKEELAESSFFWDEFINFCKIVSKGIKTDYVVMPEVPKMFLSKDDILSLTHDFYKNLNPFFFSNFMKNFYRRFDHVNFATKSMDNYSGFSLCLSYRNESFIEIIGQNTIEDVLISIHEFEHATHNSINSDHFFNQNTLFIEIDTLFMELIAQDYLRSFTNNKDIPIIRYRNLMEYLLIGNNICDLISLTAAEETLENGFTSNKILKTTALNECGIIP